MNANHLAGSKFETVSQKTSKQIQPLLPRRGQPVHPVSYFQELKHGSVLGPLGVRVVQLQNQVANRLWVKVHAVAKHLDAVDRSDQFNLCSLRPFQLQYMHSLRGEMSSTHSK